MFTTSPMELVSMLVLKEKTEEVISYLITLGIFHPVDISKIEQELSVLSVSQIEDESAEWQAFEIKLRDTLRKFNSSPAASKEAESLPVTFIKSTFVTIDEKLEPLISQINEAREALKINESMRAQVKDYFLFPIKKSSLYTFLEVTLGRVEEKNIAALERSLKDIPHLVYTLKKELGKVTAILIGLKRDKALLDRVLHDFAWEKVEFPEEHKELSKDVEAQIQAKIEESKKRIETANAAIRELANTFQGTLSKIRSCIILKKSLLYAKKYLYTTDRTVILSGWVPREEKERLIREIKKIAGASYVEGKKAEDVDISKEEIPVQIQHWTLFKPFELLINSYGVVRYGTIDPTIFVAFSFLLMFGAMFGDLGHGLIFVLTGILLLSCKKPKLKQASALLLYCGISSSIFGILYGSFFGYEKILPAIWIKPMLNVIEAFRVSIIFGITLITLGIIINIVNALRDKDYVKAVFDKAGLVSGIVYITAIAWLSKNFVSTGRVSPLYPIVISGGFLLLFCKPFIELLSKKKKNKESLFVSFMESTVDILEIVMGYLANTVSFIRIAAFALAHAGLFLAIFELSRLLRQTGGAVLSLVVIIFGNILIILLEGLVVGIQSLRLNYYEFFSKFFITGKHIYQPLTFKER
ncbi:MAG: V-type ATPase 116kDa subunit family protein [Candidatus Omnitrophota bacterium]